MAAFDNVTRTLLMVCRFQSKALLELLGEENVLLVSRNISTINHHLASFLSQI